MLTRKHACVRLLHQLHRLFYRFHVHSQKPGPHTSAIRAASKDVHSQIRLILTLAHPIRGTWIGCSLIESHVSTPNLSDEADGCASSWKNHVERYGLYYTLAICVFYFLPISHFSGSLMIIWNETLCSFTEY